MIIGLQRSGLVSACESWQFWDRPSREFRHEGKFPTRIFQADEAGRSTDFARHIAEAGEPDLLWVEGRHYPLHLARLLDLCPRSFKILETQNWRPWSVEGIERYDFCIVDEESQARKVKKLFPNVRCGVWDKLIDYESSYYPIQCEKDFDLCYVAELNRRKQPELLLQAAARLPERKLTCVFVGADRKGMQAKLERLAADLNVTAHFAGEVSREDVNAYINRSLIGVVCAKRDAVPRILLEYMAADVPVLANAELRAGTRYVGPRAGLIRSPEEFHLGIAEILDNYGSYSPRQHLLEHYSQDRVVAHLVKLLEQAGFSIESRRPAT
jgi:glycosyltransferase involved in cell wall biosynthesis